MSIQRWTISITLEAIEEDGEAASDRSEVSLVIRGAWEPDGGQRPVNECIAIDLASLATMIHESGKLLCESTKKDTASAFADSVASGEPSDE